MEITNGELVFISISCTFVKQYSNCGKSLESNTRLISLMISLYTWYLTNEFKRIMSNWLGMVTWKCQGFYSRQWSVFIGDEQGPRNSTDRTRKANRIGAVVASRIIRCLRNAIFNAFTGRTHSFRLMKLLWTDPNWSYCRNHFTWNRARFVTATVLKFVTLIDN